MLIIANFINKSQDYITNIIYITLYLVNYVRYKTAWILSHKIRESLLDDRDSELLSGTCEIDGVYVGGKTRQVNAIAELIRESNHLGLFFLLKSGRFIIM